MKCNHSRPGFELESLCPFPTTITITPQAPPQWQWNVINLVIILWIIWTNILIFVVLITFCQLCSLFWRLVLNIWKLNLLSITWSFEIRYINFISWKISMEKKLDGNYKRVLQAILSKSWKRYPTKQLLYNHMPSPKPSKLDKWDWQDAAWERRTTSQCYILTLDQVVNQRFSAQDTSVKISRSSHMVEWKCVDVMKWYTQMHTWDTGSVSLESRIYQPWLTEVCPSQAPPRE